MKRSPGIMHLFASLEELATGQAQVEKEFVLYAKVDHAWLVANAQSIEDHEQWELRIAKTEGNECGGRMRVRKTVYLNQAGLTTYVQTVKTKLADWGEKEVATSSSADGFAQFKAMSERGMVKRRHRIACPGRASSWEVDVFFNADGTPHEWVKIDYELKEGETDCPDPHAQFKEVVRPGHYPRTPTGKQDVEDFIRNLYDTVFLKTNRPAV